MRFLFVDRIHAVESNSISGSRYFGANDPWQYSVNGNSFVATSVISEAVGQLVSWLTLKENNFSARPVFLFVTKIDLDGQVAPGSNVELFAEVTDRKDDSFLFSGTAKIGDRTIVTLQDCGGYFMPLSELEDPEKTRARFQNLICVGVTDCHEPSPRFNFNSLLDSVEQRVEGQEIRSIKKFSHVEPFYADHFPRFPVTPIVVINEMIGRATSQLWTQSKDLIPISVNDLKIRSFIRPGDIAQTTIKVTEMFQDQIETIAEVSVEGKRILRGRYRYKINRGDS